MRLVANLSRMKERAYITLVIVGRKRVKEEKGKRTGGKTPINIGYRRGSVG